MIDYKYNDLFRQDSIGKNLIVETEDGVLIENGAFYSESFELTETLCSTSELRFGSCEASEVKFQIRNEFGSLLNKRLNISMALDGKDDTPFQLGRYTVASDIPSGDKKYTNITAYDVMYDIINAEVVAWYDGLTFPISMKDFRDSFFAYLGVEQVKTTLIQDDMTIEKTIDADSISGKQVVTAICELNGVFGHINRQGKFAYVPLAGKTSECLYPRIDLYPSNSLYSATTPCNSDYYSEVLNSSKYISCEYEDFNTSFISRLQIRQEENDIGAIVGDGTNTYIIEDNFLVYGKNAEELSNIASKVFDTIKNIQYRPFKATLRGNPCLEVGDAVVFHTRYKDVESYVFERTIKGIQSLRDTFEARGVYEYKEKVNSVQKDIRRLKGKTNVLERTVEKLESTITDKETGLQTQIKQTAEKVEIMTGDDYVSSKISVELGKILLKGNRIAIESDYFKLSEDGSIEATNGYFRGTFEQYNTNGVKSVEIRGNEVMVYAWHDEGNYVGSFGALRRVGADGTTRGLVSMWCDYYDILTLNYNSPTDSNTKKSVFSFDPVDMENGHTPWIKNTSSGTLFPDNPGGGIKVENGLIKAWNMSGSTSTIFPDNPAGGITLKNGLVTGWHLTGATGTLFPNNTGGGVTIVNGLITKWSLNRVSDSTLNVVTGVHLNNEGLVDGFHFTNIKVKDGMIVSWTTSTRWIEVGWMT